MLKQNDFYSFKHHAYVEPCNFFDFPGSTADQQYYKQAGKRTLTLRTFFKIVCGLYEEMERSDENRSPGNWFLARNFLKYLF